MMETVESLIFDSVFISPEYLDILPWLGVFFALWLAFVVLKRMRRPEMTQGSRYPWIGSIKLWAFVLVSSAAVVIALARPASRVQLNFDGPLDALVMIDNSLSMCADDIGNSSGYTRLDKAKEELLRLVDERMLQPQDRVGLYRFGRVTTAPIVLSTDLDRFQQDVGSISCPDNLSKNLPWGSDPIRAFEEVFRYWDLRREYNEMKDRPSLNRDVPRIVILVTDGEDYANDNPDISRLIEGASQRNIKIYSIGVGTRGGVSWLSLLDGYREGEDYDPNRTRTWSGRTTRLETSMIEALASGTGGDWTTVERRGEEASDFLFNSIQENREPGSASVTEQDKEDSGLWWWAALAAFSVLVFAVIFY